MIADEIAGDVSDMGVGSVSRAVNSAAVRIGFDVTDIGIRDVGLGVVADGLESGVVNGATVVLGTAGGKIGGNIATQFGLRGVVNG